MAIDFPASPSVDDTFTVGSVTYTWDGTKWTAVAAGGGATDKIEEGNTSAEVIDTGSDGRFVVTTEGSERARVDSSGRLLVGTSSARTNVQRTGSTVYTPTVQFETQGNSFPYYSFISNSTGGYDTHLVIGLSSGSAVGSNSLPPSGTGVGQIHFAGNDGTNFVSAASIYAQVDATPGANDMPGRLIFATTADGASFPTERMRIRQDGLVLVSNTFGIAPATDNITQLGGSGIRYSEVWAANGTIQTSDQRTKTQITDAALGSDFIKALRPVSYKWIEGGKRPTGAVDDENNWVYESVPGQRTHWGFIAQEVKQAVDAAGVDFGGWILTDKDDPDSQQALRYDQFIAPLTKALQEALAKIETLEAEVAALKAS